MNSKNYHLEVGQKVKFSEYSPEALVVDRFHGGFGEVYVLREIDQGSFVAAKTPRLELNVSKEILEQFAREATLWSKLPSHPNILPAYDVVRYNNQPYVRMKYVGPRTDLRSSQNASSVVEIKNTPTSESSLKGLLPTFTGSIYFEALVISQILGVLSYLEEKVVDFVHGDIKPENILLEFKVHEELGVVPRVLLSDFGFARSTLLLGHAVSLPVGDLVYLAPETFDGVIGTKAHDVFALGCTMYEIFTGTSYQTVDAKGQVIAAEHDRLDALKSSRPDLPAEVIELIRCCLQRNPQARPATFAEIHNQYIAIMKILGGKIYNIEEPPAAPKWVRDIRESEVVTYLVNRRKLDQIEAENTVMDLIEANNFAKLGEYDDSERLIRKVLTRLPSFAPALANRGYRYFLQRDFDASMYWYARAIDEFSSDSELIEADRLGAAAACATFVQTLTENPISSKEALDAALPLAHLAINLLPDSPKTYLTAGKVYLRLGEAEEAHRFFLRGQSIDPSNRAIINTLAITEFVLGQCKRENLPDIKSRFGLSDFETESLLEYVETYNLC